MAQPDPESERRLSVLAHAAALSGLVVPLGQLLGPTLVGLLAPPSAARVRREVAESLNFQLQLLALVAGLVALLLWLRAGWWWLTITLPNLYAFGMALWAAARASRGEAVRYPFVARLLPAAQRRAPELRREAYGPRGDAAHHLPLAELEAGLRSLPPAPSDAGRLALLVRRRADGARETPERVRLTPEEGLPGDGWSRRPPREPAAQLAVMRRDVAELVAGGQPLTLFGDNLFVDLDLSAANLPAGTRLRVGEALVEMTPEPHDGCLKFKGRFGQDALRFVQARPTRDQNLRGVYWRVVEPGEVAVGAPIQVLSRPGGGPR